MSSSSESWGGLLLLAGAILLAWFANDAGYDKGYEAGHESGVEDGIQYAEDNDEEQEICEYTLGEHQQALSEANENIENANFEIETAQGTAWATYQEMGYTLEGLETIETVDLP